MGEETRPEPAAEACYVCGEELDAGDRLAAPYPKEDAGVTREKAMGHYMCWSKAGFRRQINGGARPAWLASKERNDWMEQIEIPDEHSLRRRLDGLEADTDD